MTVISRIEECVELKNIWDKVFKNGTSKICRRHPLKKLKEYGLLKYRKLSIENFQNYEGQDPVYSMKRL